MSLVLQYQHEFELAVGIVRNLDLKVKIGIFLHGLKEEIQAELKASQF